MKTFNITARCYPNDHYMVDTSKKFEEILALIDRKQYFTINRPRQYGKTTMLFNIARTLRERDDYFAITTSFEGLGDSAFSDEAHLVPVFLHRLAQNIKYVDSNIYQMFIDKAVGLNSLEQLSNFISDFVATVSKKVVLLIDEVDQSSNNELFIHLLAMLRNKYLQREETPTFHSVILAGVHDVKNLKLKLRPNESAKYNSPWNIAAEFKVDMNFYPNEIAPMLVEYAQDKNLTIDIEAIAERIFYYTSGYPFLVSKLCKVFDEDILPKKQELSFTQEDLAKAVRISIREKNTNFESLIKNLENNESLYDFIYQIAIEGLHYSFNIHFPLIDLGVLHGILREQDGKTVIHNRIYSEIILNYMADKMHFLQSQRKLSFNQSYRNDDNTLDMEGVLVGFQTFMRKEYSKKDHDFLEKNGRLVFLAFLKPIINGSGYDFKEVQISEERRLDLVITFFEHKYVAELKIWRGEKAHQKGLLQLANYLTAQGLTEGYLLVFDKTEIKNWESEWIDFQDKKIFIVYL